MRPVDAPDGQAAVIEGWLGVGPIDLAVGSREGPRVGESPPQTMFDRITPRHWRGARGRARWAAVRTLRSASPTVGLCGY